MNVPERLRLSYTTYHGGSHLLPQLVEPERKSVAMSFSLPRFLRRTAPKALKEYFEAQGISFATPIDWQAGATKLVSMLAAGIDALPDSRRIFGHFERAEQLCDDIGQCALRTIVIDDRLRARMDSCHGNEARALLVLLTDEAAFDRALAIAHADSLRHGRSWSGYSIPMQGPRSTDPTDLARLEHDLKELFRASDGTGRKLKIETFERATEKLADGTERSIVQFNVYISGLPVSSMEFNRDEPERRTRWPAIEAAICHDPIAGTLEIVARGGRKIREAMARAFADHVLKLDASLTSIPPRQFDLDHLKSMAVFPTDPSDGIANVAVISLRLRDITTSLGQVTIDAPYPDRDDIRAVAAHWFGDADPLRRPECRVVYAKLRIIFHPEKQGGQPKSLTVELRFPNGSNLRDQTERHQLIAEKYLERWGLIPKPMADAA